MKVSIKFLNQSKGVALPIVLVALVALTGIGMTMLLKSQRETDFASQKRYEAKFNQRLLAGLEDSRQTLINLVQESTTDSLCTPLPGVQPPADLISLEQCEEYGNFAPTSSSFNTQRDSFQITCLSAGQPAVYDSSACTTSEDSLPQVWNIRYRSSLKDSEGSISGSVEANIIVAKEKLKDYSLMISAHNEEFLNFGGGSTYGGKVYVGFNDVDSSGDALDGKIRFLNSTPLVFKELFATSVSNPDNIKEGNPDVGLTEVEVEMQKGLLLSAPSVEGSLTSSFQNISEVADWRASQYRDSAAVRLFEESNGDCRISAQTTYTYTDCTEQQNNSCDAANTSLELLEGAFGGDGDGNDNPECGYSVVNCNEQTVAEWLTPNAGAGTSLNADTQYSLYLNSGKTYIHGKSGDDLQAKTCSNLTIVSEGDNHLMKSIVNTTLDASVGGTERPTAIVSLNGTNLIPGNALHPSGHTMQQIAGGAATNGFPFHIYASLVGLGGPQISLASSLLDPTIASSTLGGLNTLGTLVGSKGADLRMINLETGETLTGFTSVNSNYDPGVGSYPPMGFNRSEGGSLIGTTVNIHFQYSDMAEAISYWNP